MVKERTVLFAPRGLIKMLTEVEWQEGLPLPKEPNIPKGSIAIELPNGVHKGIAIDPIGELYHCIKSDDGSGYKWNLAD